MPKNFVIAYWKSIAVCVLIFILSSITFKSIPDAAKFHNSDKVTHAVMYVGLGFIAYLEYRRDQIFRTKYKNWLLYMFLIFVTFGGIIEILQGAFFKPRTAEFADWIADIVGLAVGVGIAKLYLRLRKN